MPPDFRVPEARSFTWLLSGNARWNGDYYSSPGYNSYSGSMHDLRSSLAQVFSFTHWHGESEAFVSDHFFQAQAGWQQSRSTDRYSYSGSGDQVYDHAGDLQDYRVFASTSTTRYLGASRWGVDAALSASYTYARDAFANGSGFISGSSENRSRNDTQFHDYRGALDASLGPGYGRVRDVTGVFDMQVLEDRLAATGRLSHLEVAGDVCWTAKRRNSSGSRW